MTDFVGGMISGSIRSAAARERGDMGRFFDWDKAAQIINDRKPIKAMAGLCEDWNNTSGRIYEEQTIIDYDYLYLFSMWATPVLLLDDDEEIPCFVEADTNYNTVWPDTARAIISVNTTCDHI